MHGGLGNLEDPEDQRTAGKPGLLETPLASSKDERDPLALNVLPTWDHDHRKGDPSESGHGDS